MAMVETLPLGGGLCEGGVVGIDGAAGGTGGVGVVGGTVRSPRPPQHGGQHGVAFRSLHPASFSAAATAVAAGATSLL